MPNRIIKESICESRNLSECSFFAQDLYKRLITYADDYGRFNADPQIMLARLYPREMAIVTINDIVDGLIELCGVEKIGFYTSKPRCEVYGAFPHWGEHQRIRDSKKKNPEPTNTEVNDWYLRRFISIKLKVAILERDNFKCQICGKQIADSSVDALKLIKMGTGLFHFDHIVPCQQGGRATAENLQLTCAKCNLSRQKIFTVDELLQFAESSGKIPEVSENSRNLPPNPIQSESLSNPNPYPNPMLDDATAAEIQHDHDRVFTAAEDAGFKMSNTVRSRLIALYADNGLEKMLAGFNECATHGAPTLAYLEAVLKGTGKKKPQMKVLPAQDFPQRDYSGVQDVMMGDLEKEIAAMKAGEAG